MASSKLPDPMPETPTLKHERDGTCAASEHTIPAALPPAVDTASTTTAATSPATVVHHTPESHVAAASQRHGGAWPEVCKDALSLGPLKERSDTLPEAKRRRVS